jgi:hypothetical protein
MTETHTDMTGTAPDLAQVAAIDFAPVDPTLQTIPSAEDWDCLYSALATAAAVLSKTKAELQDMLAGGDADGLLESMAATLRAAGERFGEFQAICEAAEARVYIAAGALSVSIPAGI